MKTVWRRCGWRLAELLAWALASGIAWSGLIALMLGSEAPVRHALLAAPLVTVFLFGLIALVVLPAPARCKGPPTSRDEPEFGWKRYRDETSGQYTARGLLNNTPIIQTTRDDT